MPAAPTPDAVTAAAAAAGSVTVAMLGVHPQLLVFAACGAFIGLSFAPAAGRLRAIGVFAAVVLLSAAFGHAGAEWLNLTGAGAPRALAGVIGLVFHPIVGAVVNLAPEVLRSWLLRRPS